ncbi:hypothetical protein RVR_9490 [Actinacidiphila reveromycinica]|uniref:UspA domain-containing protein n=1 Tax=Actinacidiphila reveromycinica TaxID=659352 RepID=A0A7U3UZU9_9ACTN|nr:universal stress protein [Streptomyces sp. SN-593]BBB01877.1 hypothetical protein RVR_9490 [Streptomyces sp. SN-593]
MSPPRVLVGIDGSVTSFLALETAAAEARLRGARLELLACAADPAEAGPVLRAAVAHAARLRPGLTVTASSATGDPADVLVRLGRHAQLTVVGARAVGGGAGLLAHSVARRVAARAAAPLVVVRGMQPRPRVRDRRTGRVLLAVEDDADADAALFAFQEAELRGTTVAVLHPWTYRRRTGTGTAAPRCLPRGELAKATEGAGLIVVGARRHARWTSPPPGPVADLLLRHARCPVAVVPPPRNGTGPDDGPGRRRGPGRDSAPGPTDLAGRAVRPPRRGPGPPAARS